MTAAWIESLHAGIAQLRAADPAYARFGAGRHRYACHPALGEDGVRALEQRLGAALPADLRAYAGEVASGGAGPCYGVIPLARAPLVSVPAAAGARWSRGVAIAHAGCGYALIAALDGDAAGEIWLYAEDLGRSGSVAPTFSALLATWLACVLRGEWLPWGAPDGVCALPAALSGYLAAAEARLGIAAGMLAGEPLRDALAALGPGTIELGVDRSPLFAPGDRVDPCQTCARLIDGLATRGLDRAAIAAGIPPQPER
jgi:hypothetical protein